MAQARETRRESRGRVNGLPHEQDTRVQPAARGRDGEVDVPSEGLDGPELAQPRKAACCVQAEGRRVQGSRVGVPWSPTPKSAVTLELSQSSRRAPRSSSA